MREQPSNMQRDILALHMEEQVEGIAAQRFGKTIRTCTNHEMYYVLLIYCKRLLAVTEHNVGEKRVYYLSAEFMIGRLLENNLINLKVYDRMKALLAKNGKSLTEIEEYEPEPALGCSGPGRLASCMLDAIATLDYPGEGIGLNYHYGLFRQGFEDHQQKEFPEAWMEKLSWEKRTETSYNISLGGHKVYSRMYDIDIIGWDAGVNKLHLFDIDYVERDEDSQLRIPKFETIADKPQPKNPAPSGASVPVRPGANREEPLRDLTLSPYTDHADRDGMLLRLCQQYFMVSNAVRWIMHEMHDRKYNAKRLHHHAVIQINNTYPALVIPELILILSQEKALSLNEAIDVASKTCAYTDHTTFSGEQEVCLMEHIRLAAPQLLSVLEELDRRVRLRCDDPDLWIISADGEVLRLTNLVMHYCFSINRATAIQDDVLNQTGLYRFYDLYPEKFNIKINGITFRRWLLSCNHPLADFLSAKISDAYKRDPGRLEDLLVLQNEPEILDELGAVRRVNKVRLAEYVKKRDGLILDPDGIYDMQVNRLHEYKRQQMNAMYIVHKYLEVRAGKKPERPINFIFGAKANPGRQEAQDIIHLLLVLQDIVNNDPLVNRYLHVALVANYDVTYSEMMYPACDISEQISLAFREGVSTSSMKFMLNGAVTLGTLDRANMDILDLVGEDNIYLFGMDPNTVIERFRSGTYCPKDYYDQSDVIRETVDFIIGPECCAVGHKEMLERVREGFLHHDRFMAMADLEDYIRVKDRMIRDYEDRQAWNRMCLINIAKAGYYSADRMVEDYNRDIWHLR